MSVDDLGPAELVRQHGRELAALLTRNRVATVALHHRAEFGYTFGWVLGSGFAMTEQGHVYAAGTDAWGHPEISGEPLSRVDTIIFTRAAAKVREGSFGHTYGPKAAATGPRWAAALAVVVVIVLCAVACGLLRGGLSR